MHTFRREVTLLGLSAIIFTILSNPSLGQSNWEIIHKGENRLFYEISFTDGKNGWVSSVLQPNTIYHTSDGGKTWIERKVKTGDIGHLVIGGIYFISPDEGWVIGSGLHGGFILHTSDGGNKWNIQFKDESGITPLEGVFFLDNNEGWVVGRGIILHTKNGGEKWEISHRHRKDVILWKVHFINENDGWVVGDKGTILHTRDGGKSWDKQRSGTEMRLEGVYFVNKYLGWVAAGDSILHTDDGGKSWHKQFEEEGAWVIELQFFDENEGWAVGGKDLKGMTFHTRDGGESWELKSTPGIVLFDLHFINRFEGWIVGKNNIILHTKDGGRNWESQFQEGSNTYTSVQFLSKDRGWISWRRPGIGDRGGILYTGDGGDNFLAQAEFDIGIDDVYFVNDQEGWAVGGTRTWRGPGGIGAIFHTEDGGKSWDKQAEDLKIQRLHAVQFLDKHSGWAVGEGGAILHTEDGGITWRKQEGGIDFNLYDLKFVNEDEGWCVGGKRSNGIVLYTIDGGENWEVQLEVEEKPLNGVYFLNPKEGWVAGGEDVDIILETKNGGKIWKRQFERKVMRGYSRHRSIYFLDSMRGFVAGRGAIMTTEDGGENWKEKVIFEVAGMKGATDLIDISYDGEGAIWVVGRPEAILKLGNLLASEREVELIDDALIGTWGKIKIGSLYQNYPNPFNAETWIPFSLCTPNYVHIRIYDVQGRLVKGFNLGYKGAGLYLSKDKAVHWDGRNDRREEATSGVYFYTLQAGSSISSTLKLVLVK